MKFKLSDFGGALEDANKTIQLDPKSADGYIIRGVVQKELGVKEGACSDFQKAVEFGSKGAKIQVEGYCSSDE